MVLEAAGHEVDVVAGGAEAITAVVAKPYDLILMDVQMAGMDGMVATRKIRALSHPARDLPIIAMTANVFPEQIRAFRQAGMSDHVGKPFKHSELYATVDRWLRRSAKGPIGEAGHFSHESPRAGHLDEQAFRRLKDVLGDAKAADLLNRLAMQFAERLDSDATQPEAREQWRRSAHMMIGAAGTIGFVDLADLCHALEITDPASPEFDRCLERLRAELRSCLTEIRGLESTLPSKEVKISVPIGAS